MKGSGLGWLIVTLVAACVPHLEPVEPIETDRPDETESTALVPVGMIQAEGGTTLNRSGGLHETTIGETLIRIGVAPSLELRIEPLTHTTASADGARMGSGLEDAAIGIKTPLHRRALGSSAFVPDLSLLVATSLPTGSRLFRAAGPEPEAKLAAQWSLSDRLDAGANLTTRRTRDEGGSFWERGLTSTLGLTLSQRAGSFVEWYGIRDQRETRQVVDGGVTFRLSSDFQVDARVGKARREEGGFVGVGVARRW
jgi:hypothetical protein